MAKKKTKNNAIEKKGKGGRPTIMTEETVKKLEEVFVMGGSDSEACYFANISKQTLYTYQEKHPEFADRKEALKNWPTLKARRTVVSYLDDPNYAFKYLERKKKDEFGNNVDVTSGGEPIQNNIIQVTNFSNNKKDKEKNVADDQ